MSNTPLNGREYRNPVTGRLNRLPKLLLVSLFIFIVSVTSLHAGSQRTMVNLRGDQVVVPIEVPPKERFVLQRLINVDDRLIVFLYSDPKFRRPVDYAETYNLKGELLEISWYKPTEGVKRVRDINLGNPKATGPARILKILNDLPEQTRVTESKGLLLDSQN